MAAHIDKTFHAPTDETERAGRRSWKRPKTAYDIFMDEEGIPVYRGMGMYDVRQIPMMPWRRLGGKGSYIQLDGTEGRIGMYVVEIPPAGMLNPERHLYEEVYFVVDGRGTTEVWREGSSRKLTFEWKAGSLFAIPLNTCHRLVNATSSPALLVGGTTAPVIFNTFRNTAFVYNNSYEFFDRFDEREDYFKPNEELAADEIHGRATQRTALIPDIVGGDLPLDNQRSPGYRRVEPHMAGCTDFFTFIGQHKSGRYAQAHYPVGPGSAVLICIKGKGYTYSWDRKLGIRPWEAGASHSVQRQEYVPCGMVSANPGGTGYFHAHYGIAKEPLRFLVFANPRHVRATEGRLGDEEISGNLPIEEGGRTITYKNEDPFIRKEYTDLLAKEGLPFDMPESVYV